MKRLRLGRHHNDLVYVQQGDEPSDDDRRFGVFSTPEDAAMVVGWGNHLAGLNRTAAEWASGDVERAIAHWSAQLARLDRVIAEGSASQFPGVVAAARLRIPDRQHLAVLLRTLGVDVPDLQEGP